MHKYYVIDGLRISVTEHGNPDRPLVFCWHGLLGNSTSFTRAALHLKRYYFVVCPDAPGAGRSSRAPAYSRDLFVNVALHLYRSYKKRYGHNHLGWIGTSAGGALGILLAHRALLPIRYLVINDIGPEVSPTFVKGIRDFNEIAHNTHFPDVPAFKLFYRNAHSHFGERPREFWEDFLSHSYRVHPSGEIKPSFDYNMVISMLREKWNLWKEFEELSEAVRILIFRGELSRAFPVSVFERMMRAQPSALAYEIKESGHFPGLYSVNTLEIITPFLSSIPQVQEGTQEGKQERKQGNVRFINLS
jgi:pimeloyl-ACP methyl ester carboxylesterase